ncbi:MAG TPA: PepSY domain-containing protein [Clostridia bacterium]|nr:MAG: Peptidase propeptide and YPEB domain protein [Firmicutes bacterium ADurb.Bin356]HOF94768.1 PepSY domain-containing protein [Clostridia bacterium]HOR13430.1 PepSY domain-containing protein [Clostridia bacterium]
MHNDPWYNSRVTPLFAVEAALEQVMGQVTEVELETEHGRLVYEVEIVTDFGKYEVRVDAYTGEVLDVELD